jgi:protein required for attachment to host cells
LPLPNQALVLVLDGRKMLFFRNQGDEAQIDLRTEAHDERQDFYDRDLKTDSPGTAAHSAGAHGSGVGAVGGGHVSRPVMEETDYHQQDEDNWVKDAAEELKKRALSNDFEALAIVAPPKALGVLRKALHKEVERRIVCSINKEMSGRPIPDIEALITSETAPEEPADV